MDHSGQRGRSRATVQDFIRNWLTNLTVWADVFRTLNGHRFQVATYFLPYTFMFFFRSGLRALGLDPSFNWLFSSPKHTDVWLVRRHDGLQFFCRQLPSLDCMIQSDSFEGKLWTCFSRVESGMFIDVGAHIGKYAVKVGKKLEGTGQVFAVEPEAHNFALLQRNVAINRLGNVTCLKCACFSENTQMRLFLHSNPLRHALRNCAGCHAVCQSPLP